MSPPATRQSNTYFAATDGMLSVTTGPATTTTIARHTGTSTPSTYGDSLSFDVTVTGSSPSGTVTLKDGGSGGTTIGNGTLSGGTCTITPAVTALGASTHLNIVAIYAGDDNNSPSISSVLSPSQVVNKKTVVPTVALNDKLTMARRPRRRLRPAL